MCKTVVGNLFYWASGASPSLSCVYVFYGRFPGWTLGVLIYSMRLPGRDVTVLSFSIRVRRFPGWTRVHSMWMLMSRLFVWTLSIRFAVCAWLY